MFRNTLTANEKYPVRNGGSFTSPIQMQLSLKLEFFSDCFVASLVSTSNFEHFEEKMIVIATLFRKLQTMKDLDRLLSKKHCFRTPLDSQHAKVSKTYIKSS